MTGGKQSQLLLRPTKVELGLQAGKYRNTSLAVQGALARWGFLFLFLLLWQGENKVNSYSDQLKLGQVCKFGVEFDKNMENQAISSDIFSDRISSNRHSLELL